MAFTTIQGSGGAPDSFLGTAGVDVIALQNQADASFLSARQSDDVVTFTSFTQLVSNYTLYGGQGADTLTANNNTTLSNSFVAQNEGNDTITLAALTSSTVQGNQGNDTITVNGLITSALVNGNQGNDTINVNAGATAGLIYGGVGFDQIAVSGALNGTTRVQANEDDDIITIAAGTSLQDATINGNQGNDNIVLNGVLTAFANSTIYGGSGNDNINEGVNTRAIAVSTDDGNDTVTLNAGNNQVFNSAGNDSITGGTGNDTVTSTSGNVTVTFAAGGNNSFTGAAGNINVTGGAGTDTVVTGTGTDTIVTGGGASTVDAGGGNDIVTGDAGTESLNGGTGNDTITGNAAADQLTGSAGADNFVYVAGAGTTAAQVAAANGLDNITDFSVLQNDVLGVVNLLASAEAFNTSANGAATGNANVIVITAIQGGGAALTAAQIEDLYTPGSTLNERGVVLVNNNGVAQLWYDQDLDNDGAGATLTQIGTLTGVNLATAGFTAANFA